METIEMIRLGSYTFQGIVLFILSAYFFREYLNKRLRASLAWAIGFLMFAIAVISAGFMATVQLTKPLVSISFVFTALFLSLLYYGASLLFFKEGSFFREKMAILYFAVVIILGNLMTYATPLEQILERLSGPGLALQVPAYLAIAILFLQVSRRIPKGDPRKRTIRMVSAAWWIIVAWNTYLIFFFGKFLTVEAIGLILSSGGFMLLLYGMTTGKTTR